MLKTYNFTKTTNYLLRRYQSSSIDIAIQRAVNDFCINLFKENDDIFKIPIDIELVAKNNGIKIIEDIEENEDKEGELVVTPNEFLVRLKPGIGVARRRFTIAHELGHTLFYKKSRHQICIRNRNEYDAEENLCNKFASTLLMPLNQTRNLISQITINSAWDTIRQIEYAAHKVQVSLPAFIYRLNQIIPKSPSALILVSNWREHKRVRVHPTLRLLNWTRLGNTHNVRTWSQRTMEGLNLNNALKLFNTWHINFTKDSSLTGRFVIASESDKNFELQRASINNLSWLSESVNLSILEKGKWLDKTIPVKSAHCLYASPKTSINKVYVLSVIKF